MKTKSAIEYRSAPYYYTTTIPAGTPVTPASNLPQGGWWVGLWEGISDQDAAWQRNYGFLVTDEEVIE